jgi:class 3 adenylate cyclase
MANVETITILITDLVGSTSLESQVGPARADELRQEHFSIIRDAIGDSEGAREVKNTGDGIMAAFPSAAGATECATAIQQRFHQRNEDAEEQLVVRIGISMGDATHENGDYFGMPSIEAARLCDKAEGGGILIPELVKMMVGRRGGDSFRSVGALELKGIPEPVEAYEVAWEPLTPEDRRLPLPSRLLGTPPLGYVGRSDEIQELDQLWERAGSGQRQVGLVAGEPGIGKTRLVTHAAISKHSDGATILYGRCEEDLATPYGPWIEALTHYVQHAPEDVLGAHIQTYGGELTRLVPALKTRIEDAPAPRDTDPETERYLLFSAIAGLLGSATAVDPLMLLLDDLHWADKPTLALLKHVVGSSESMALLVLGTYRDSELSRQHPLTDTLADLRSEQGVKRMSLDGLGEQDVVKIMENVAGHEMDKLGLRLAQGIAGETSGNPFFVSEMLRHLTESGMLVQRDDGRWVLEGEVTDLGLPQSVREVVGRRIERLGEDSRGALAAAAVIGRDFEVELLTRVTELNEDKLLDLLEEAVEASVLLEKADRPGSFTFAHALINHTLYEDLSATRRARLHKRVAEALEEISGDDPDAYAAELANHWAAATTSVDASKALDYSRRAGEKALANLAPDEAVRWFGKALELCEQQSGDDPSVRCDLLIGLGEAQRQAGEWDFRQTLLDASAIAQELGDGDRLAKAAISNNRGFMSTAGITDHEVISALEAAIELTDEDQLDRRATLLSLLSLESIWSVDLARRQELADQALDLARKSGDERSVAFVLWRRFNPTAVPETLDQRIAEMAEMREIVDRQGDPYLRYFAALYSSTQAFENGDRSLLDKELGQLGKIADDLRQPVPRWSALWTGAVDAFLKAELGRAEELTEQAAQVAVDAGQPDALSFYTGQLQMIRWAQDRQDEVEEILVQGAEDNPNLSPYQALLALVQCEIGKTDEARAGLDAVAAGDFRGIPREMLWLSTMVQWAAVAAETKHAGAERLYELLEPWADQFPCISITTWLPTAYYLGLLDAALGRLEQAEGRFARALELSEAAEAPLFAACIRLEWGRALVESGDPKAAERGRELLNQALSAGQELDIPRVEGRAERLLAGAATTA